MTRRTIVPHCADECINGVTMMSARRCVSQRGRSFLPHPAVRGRIGMTLVREHLEAVLRRHERRGMHDERGGEMATIKYQPTASKPRPRLDKGHRQNTWRENVAPAQQEVPTRPARPPAIARDTRGLFPTLVIVFQPQGWIFRDPQPRAIRAPGATAQNHDGLRLPDVTTVTFPRQRHREAQVFGVQATSAPFAGDVLHFLYRVAPSYACAFLAPATRADLLPAR